MLQHMTSFDAQTLFVNVTNIGRHLFFKKHISQIKNSLKVGIWKRKIHIRFDLRKHDIYCTKQASFLVSWFKIFITLVSILLTNYHYANDVNHLHVGNDRLRKKIIIKAFWQNTNSIYTAKNKFYLVKLIYSMT